VKKVKEKNEREKKKEIQKKQQKNNSFIHSFTAVRKRKGKGRRGFTRSYSACFQGEYGEPG